MTDRLVVVGAGGFGRETLDVAEAMNRVAARWDIVGIVDDAPSDLNLERLATRGVTYLGGLKDIPGGANVAIGVGSPSARRGLHEMITARGFNFATLIHPTAVLGSEVKVGGGAVICAGVSIGTNVSLGRHTHLNPHAVIGHDTIIGDHVSVNPNATVSGDCMVGDEVLIGAGAVVLNQLTVGLGAVIGGAACVVGDVPPRVTVVGVPARERKQV
jgi:sugar O-acyltransferase (sialic acid O-acetyltransferase NeuD family)